MEINNKAGVLVVNAIRKQAQFIGNGLTNEEIQAIEDAEHGRLQAYHEYLDKVRQANKLTRDILNHAFK